MRLLSLLCWAPALSLAGTWDGYLVDFKCYETVEANHDPTDTQTYVDRDKGWELRYCAPKAKTKSFAVVQLSGLSFKLDSAGDAKAAEVVRNAGRRAKFYVTVTGEASKDTVKVDSIAMTR